VEEFFLVGYNAMLFVESRLTFWRNIASIFKVEDACCLLHAGFLLGLFFCPEGGGSVFLQNVS
jgi:hypothetical protein